MQSSRTANRLLFDERISNATAKRVLFKEWMSNTARLPMDVQYHSHSRTFEKDEMSRTTANRILLEEWTSNRTANRVIFQRVLSEKSMPVDDNR